MGGASSWSIFLIFCFGAARLESRALTLVLVMDTFLANLQSHTLLRLDGLRRVLWAPTIFERPQLITMIGASHPS